MKKNNFCVDCGKKIYEVSKRCISCSKKGKNSPKWKDGRTLKTYFCVDCGKKLKDYRSKLCVSCTQKGFRHPFFGKSFSKNHREKMSLSHLGDKNSHWRGGKAKHSDGYIWIKKRNHPFCDVRGYVLEHRLIMEAHLGRFLNPWEIVHHENSVTDDNRLENLKLFKNQAEHLKYHKEKDKEVK